MSTINSLVQIICALWIVSEIFLSLFRRAKNKSKDFDKSNSLIQWIINILSISIGINIAAKSGSSGMGSFSIGHPLTSYIGLLLVLSGIAVRWTAILTLGRQFTTTLTIVENHKIIDSGIYKYIRHPSYAGGLMSFLGLSISFSNWITFIIIFVPILFGYIYRINIEEKLLMNHFGEQYIIYARKTHRLIPKIY
jgi:protein-S-isoprenylcysteine O-methyltransferase Ste14